jgi:hypothetical protein
MDGWMDARKEGKTKNQKPKTKIINVVNIYPIYQAQIGELTSG